MASNPVSSAEAVAGFFEDLVRCETRLFNALGDRLRTEHDGLQTSQFLFLRYLAAHPGARVADLAESFAIGIGATSKGVDRHEARGWIRRDPNPDDRRSSLLSLTPAGAALLREAEATHTAFLIEWLGDGFTASEVAAAGALLARLRGALERADAGRPAG